MRHARAKETGPSDYERELSPNGMAAAAQAGEWFAAEGLRPDHALVSPALRTRQTWEQVRVGAGVELEAEFDSMLHTAGAEAALDLLRSVPSTSRTVLLVGHNPTVSELAHLLSDGLGSPDALTEMAGGYPPAAITVMTISGEWAGLGFGDGHVTRFHVARG